MIIWRFQSTDAEIAKQMATKSLMAGVVLVGLGMLILAVPQLVVIPLAILFFVIGFFCLTTAWRLFWAAKSSPGSGAEEDYEDASFREIP